MTDKVVDMFIHFHVQHMRNGNNKTISAVLPMTPDRMLEFNSIWGMIARSDALY